MEAVDNGGGHACMVTGGMQEISVPSTIKKFKSVIKNKNMEKYREEPIAHSNK